MDYSQLSDFEINKRVAISVGFPCYYVDGSYTNNLGLRGAIVNGESDSGLFMVGEFNPCQNPADAYPIIIKNRIAIIPDTAAGEWVAFNEFTLYEGDWMFASNPTHHSNGKNPLRCAMETFLMMQESQHA
ncbi:DUF2591 family protein [Cronobacter turicensis]|uniref:phage protein NinX family protein n=1 Tax=Cronobacter turicensis TaxID=413502 RepID=UPI0024C3056C|nr:phage protein NinX family protein [Cronobacter turicensis]MDK1334218.1 DUF2591 family protein [Cronobacter turicensis]